MKVPSTLLPEPPVGGKARATYEALLSAAERLLEAEGLPGLTSTAVAAEAGMATGTFYTYFADKDALLAALFARRLDDITSAVIEVLSVDSLAAEGLEATMRRVAERVLHGYRAHATVIRAALGRIPDSALLRSVYWQRHEQAASGVAAFLRVAASRGLVRAPGADSLALAMLVVMQGLNHPVVLAAQPRQASALTQHLARALTGLLAPGGQAPGR